MVFTCTDHASHYPVGCASIIVADSYAEAVRLLDAELVSRGLKGGNYSLQQFSLIEPRAVILCDGNY